MVIEFILLLKLVSIFEGIFKNLLQYFSIQEVQFSLLELLKGKLTTDPTHHSGEGIFFSSRILVFLFL